jgi:nucleoside-diphosphate-sugar epimerase
VENNDGQRTTRPNALVTGANGFMGTHMLELLAERGYDVLATDIGPSPAVRPPMQLPGQRFVYRQCDLRDRSQVAALAGDEDFDYVFHIAGLFDYSAAYKDLFDVNVLGTLNLLDALTSRSERPKRMVVWGAAGVYDFDKESPAKETSPVNPKGGYLTTKYMEERLVLETGARRGLQVTVIRPCGVYGPRSRYGVAMSIIMCARGGMGPFYFGSGSTRAGMIHVEDVCRSALFLSRRVEAAGEIYNVNDDSSYATADLMRTCAERLGFPLIPGNLPIGIMRFFVGNLGKKASKKGRISGVNAEMTDLLAYDAMLDASKIKALGWTPKHPDSLKGLLSTIDWYEKEGWL